MAEVLQVAPAVKAEPAPAAVKVTPVEGTGTVSRASVSLEPSDKTGTPAGDKPAGDRPSWLPEKFKTAEDMAKAYGELEKMKGGKPAEVVTPAAAAEKVIADAKLDMAALTTEYAGNGNALKAETLTALAAKGVTAEMVSDYIAGQEARSNEYTTKIATTVGGVEKLTSLLAWGADNLSPTEIEAANKVLSSADEGLTAMMLSGLQARYVKAVGNEPSLTRTAEGSQAVGVKPYADNSEMIKDMRSVAYRTSPAFRKTVEARLMVTTMNGVVTR